MKRLLSLLTLFCLTLLVHAEIQQPTVVVYWRFTAYPGSVQSVSRVTVQPIPPYPKLNGDYQIPNTITFIPGTYPLITNGIVSTNVAVDTPFKVTFSGPFGSRSVTNFFPSILTNGAGPYNASVYDVQAIAQFNNYVIGVWFNGTNFLGAGLAPTNLTGANGITIGGIYPNYIIGAQGQIISNAASFAVALSNNFTASNITATANLTVTTNITASGLTVTSGITNQSLTTNQPMFVSTGGQEISVPISIFTNGVSAALTALNTATSNALTATNTALLVTIAAGSNSIANSLAATNTSLIATITASSNMAASTLAATNTAILATITGGSNGIAGQLAATNTALLVTIAAGSNSIANSLAATNTALLATLLTESNHFVTALVATNSILATAIVNATNSINAATLTGVAPVAVLPPATVSQLGVVRADNATITNVGGVLYAVYTNNGSVFSISGDGVLLTNTITHSGSFATVPAGGFTYLGGPQGAGPGQPSYQPLSNITNALSTQLLLLNTGTSNALTATNAALLVTIAAGSNAISGQLAATNTTLLATISAGSNAIAGQLAATNTALLATITAISNSAASMLAATNTALLVTILATSNAPAAALAATNAALLVTIAAGSNSIANSLAATNTALLFTIATDSNTISSRLLATNTALLTTIAAGSNSISGQLAATNTALLTTIATGSNAIAVALAGTNTALVTAIINSTNTINGASLVAGPVPVGVLPVATSGALGIVRPDNLTVTISGGILSATGGGGGGGSQTPWISNINGALNGLTNVGPLSAGGNKFNVYADGSVTEAGTVIGNANWLTLASMGANGGFYVPTNATYSFSSDIALSRVSAGVLGVGSGAAQDHSQTLSAGAIIATNITNLSTVSAAFLATDSTGKIIAPSVFNASILTNVPGTNRFYDNIGRLQVDTNFDLLGTMQVNGTNAAAGQVLTAIDGSGGVAFRPGGGTFTTYYVSAVGSDSNDGSTPQTAWQTFAHAEQTAIPNSVIAFNAAQEAWSNGPNNDIFILTNPGTYTSYNGTCTFYSTNTNTFGIIRPATNNITLSNISFQYSTNAASVPYNTFSKANCIFMACFASGLTNINILNCSMFNGAAGFESFATNAGQGTERVSIIGCLVSNCGAWGINGNCTTQPPNTYLNRDWVVANNVVEYTQGQVGLGVGVGISMLAMVNGIFTNNTATQNGYLYPDVGGGPGGMDFVYSASNLISGNWSFNNYAAPGGNDGCGIDLDIQTYWNTVSGNMCFGNGGPGIENYLSGNNNSYIRNICFGNAQSYILGTSLLWFGAEFMFDQQGVTNDLIESNILTATVQNVVPIYGNVTNSPGCSNIYNMFTAPMRNGVNVGSVVVWGPTNATWTNSSGVGNNYWTEGAQNFYYYNGSSRGSLGDLTNAFNQPVDPNGTTGNPYILGLWGNWPDNSQWSYFYLHTLSNWNGSAAISTIPLNSLLIAGAGNATMSPTNTVLIGLDAGYMAKTPSSVIGIGVGVLSHLTNGTTDTYVGNAAGGSNDPSYDASFGSVNAQSRVKGGSNTMIGNYIATTSYELDSITAVGFEAFVGFGGPATNIFSGGIGDAIFENATYTSNVWGFGHLAGQGVAKGTNSVNIASPGFDGENGEYIEGTEGVHTNWMIPDWSVSINSILGVNGQYLGINSSGKLGFLTPSATNLVYSTQTNGLFYTAEYDGAGNVGSIGNTNVIVDFTTNIYAWTLTNAPCFSNCFQARMQASANWVRYTLSVGASGNYPLSFAGGWSPGSYTNNGITNGTHLTNGIWTLQIYVTGTNWQDPRYSQIYLTGPGVGGGGGGAGGGGSTFNPNQFDTNGAGYVDIQFGALETNLTLRGTTTIDSGGIVNSGPATFSWGTLSLDSSGNITASANTEYIGGLTVGSDEIIDGNLSAGTISSPLASSSVLGVVEVDGNSIAISPAGVISESNNAAWTSSVTNSMPGNSSNIISFPNGSNVVVSQTGLAVNGGTASFNGTTSSNVFNGASNFLSYNNSGNPAQAFCYNVVYPPTGILSSNMTCDFTAGPVALANNVTAQNIIFTNQWIYTPGPGTNEIVCVTWSPVIAFSVGVGFAGFTTPISSYFTNNGVTVGSLKSTATSVVGGLSYSSQTTNIAGLTGYSIVLTNSNGNNAHTMIKGFILNL